jgi:hypothetical protein
MLNDAQLKHFAIAGVPTRAVSAVALAGAVYIWQVSVLYLACNGLFDFFCHSVSIFHVVRLYECSGQMPSVTGLLSLPSP